MTPSFAAAARADEADDDARLRALLDRILTPAAATKAVYGGHVVDLASGRTLYEANADRPLIPASVMKMVVCAAAIDRLGADYQFETRFGLTPRDLVVIGGGDPTLGDEKLCQERGERVTALFHRWADELLARGIRVVPGQLVIDDSVFDRIFTHPNWPTDQYQEWYEAPIGGLNFADNCVDVSITVEAGAAAPALSLTPPNTYMKLVNQARVGGRGGLVARRAREAPEIVVSGATSKTQRLGPIAVNDPGLYFAACLRTVLASRGIRIDGPIERRRVLDEQRRLPSDFRLVATQRTPLRDAVRRACTDSLGMMAEGVIKALGAGASATGSWPTGQAVVIGFARRLGISEDAFSIDDGSGLSRNNGLSPRSATTVLAALHRHPAAEMFRGALAQGGEPGTLHRRLRTPDVRGNVWAKTGYINNVRTLAGYVRTSDGRWLAFAFFYNRTNSTATLRDAQDNALRTLARLPRVEAPATQSSTERRRPAAPKR